MAKKVNTIVASATKELQDKVQEKKMRGVLIRKKGENEMKEVATVATKVVVPQEESVREKYNPAKEVLVALGLPAATIGTVLRALAKVTGGFVKEEEVRASSEAAEEGATEALAKAVEESHVSSEEEEVRKKALELSEEERKEIVGDYFNTMKELDELLKEEAQFLNNPEYIVTDDSAIADILQYAEPAVEFREDGKVYSFEGRSAGHGNSVAFTSNLYDFIFGWIGTKRKVQDARKRVMRKDKELKERYDAAKNAVPRLAENKNWMDTTSKQYEDFLVVLAEVDAKVSEHKKEHSARVEECKGNSPVKSAKWNSIVNDTGMVFEAIPGLSQDAVKEYHRLCTSGLQAYALRDVGYADDEILRAVNLELNKEAERGEWANEEWTKEHAKAIELVEALNSPGAAYTREGLVVIKTVGAQLFKIGEQMEYVDNDYKLVFKSVDEALSALDGLVISCSDGKGIEYIPEYINGKENAEGKKAFYNCRNLFGSMKYFLEEKYQLIDKDDYAEMCRLFRLENCKQFKEYVEWATKLAEDREEYLENLQEDLDQIKEDYQDGKIRLLKGEFKVLNPFSEAGVNLEDEYGIEYRTQVAYLEAQKVRVLSSSDVEERKEYSDLLGYDPIPRTKVHNTKVEANLRNHVKNPGRIREFSNGSDSYYFAAEALVKRAITDEGFRKCLGATEGLVFESDTLTSGLNEAYMAVREILNAGMLPLGPGLNARPVAKIQAIPGYTDVASASEQ